MRNALAAVALLVSICAHAAGAQETAAQPQGRQFEDPSPLSFDEIATLSSTAKPEGQLAARLDSILTIPFVHNDATAAGAEPHRPTVNNNLGPVVRVGFWNIERGLNFELIRAALTDTDDFERFARRSERHQWPSKGADRIAVARSAKCGRSRAQRS